MMTHAFAKKKSLDPRTYWTFLIYCKRRKECCRDYHQLKKRWSEGKLELWDYSYHLQKLHERAIEIEIKYFDILFLKLTSY